MRKVHRLIFRLDFPVCYEFLNRTGDALKIIYGTRQEFWDDLGGSPARQPYTAKWSDQQLHYRDLSIEPTSINGAFETASGVEPNEVSAFDVFKNFSEITNELCDSLRIEDLTRCGLRVFCLAKSEDNPPESPVSRYRSNFLSNDRFGRMETAVKGRIDDISVTAVGACEDEANFRITFGPTATSDLENVVFNSLTLNDEQKDLLSQNHFTADIDVFEKNFSFRGMTLASWSRTSWALVESVLDEVEQGMAAD